MGKLRRWVLRLMVSSNLRRNHHDSWLIDAEASKHSHASCSQRLSALERLAGEDPASSASRTRLPQPRSLLSRSWSSRAAPHQADGVALSRSRTTNGRTPKGYVAVYVGQDDNQRDRFLIPISYLSHSGFQELLKRAEHEFGFEQKAGLLIPCTVAEFQHKINLLEPEDLHHPQCLSLEKPSWSRTRSFKRL